MQIQQPKINTKIQKEIDLKILFYMIMQYKFKIAFFTFILTIFAIIFSLSIPNSYKSSTILVPQEAAKPSLGGLASLAGLAGVSIGSGGELGVSDTMITTLNDYSFASYIIQKYNLNEKIAPSSMYPNMVFALGYKGIYDMFHNNHKNNEKTQDEIIYDTFKTMQKIIHISADKNTGAITLSAITQDRFLSKKLVEIYLKEITIYVKTREMSNVDKKIKYYKNELQNTFDVQLKQQLSQLLSSLFQKKVLSQANEFYNVSKITEPTVAYIKDKTKPKRALIVIISFIISIILGIFSVFFIEFLKNDESIEHKN